MNEIVAEAALGLAAAVVLLAASVFSLRLAAGSRRRRNRLLRPELERAIAAYLAGDEAEPPARPAGPSARRVFREVALDALAELRGRERERLTALLERTGMVAEAAAQLRARRRLVRRRAADALSVMRSAGATDALLGGLRDPDRHVRVACARALAEIGEEGAVAQILHTVEREVVESPGSIAEVLLALGAHAAPVLAEMLATTRSDEIRRLVAVVLGELRLAEYAPLLREALESDDDELVARAARGLGLIGDVDAVERLVELLVERNRPWFVRAVATKALGEIGDARAVRGVEWQLRADSWWLKVNAARALSLLGAPGEAALRRALDSSRSDTRSLARVALER